MTHRRPNSPNGATIDLPSVCLSDHPTTSSSSSFPKDVATRSCSRHHCTLFPHPLATQFRFFHALCCLMPVSYCKTASNIASSVLRKRKRETGKEREYATITTTGYNVLPIMRRYFIPRSSGPNHLITIIFQTPKRHSLVIPPCQIEINSTGRRGRIDTL